MKLTLSDKKYTFLRGYQKENQYRAAFNTLAKKVFGLSFEDWYRYGYWNEKYIPYTLFDGEKAVANVSVNIMDFNALGEQQRYIQIGTVMVDEAYRGQYLNRFLMEEVLAEWNEKCDFIYLFANHTVLELYPKFGFRRVKEYAYFKPVQKNTVARPIEKLDMDIQKNKDLLYGYVKNSKVLAKLSMQENADLVMFYCTSFLKDHVYYIPSLDAFAVAIFNDQQLHLWDVFSQIEVDLDEVTYSLANDQTNETLLGFTSIDCSAYQIKEISSDDTLFIQIGKTGLFEENNLMFPLLSHA